MLFESFANKVKEKGCLSILYIAKNEKNMNSSSTYRVPSAGGCMSMSSSVRQSKQMSRLGLQVLAIRDQLSLHPFFNICTGTDIYRSYSPGVPPCPNGFGLVQGSMNGRGNGRGSIRNYFPGYPGYYVKSTNPLLNPQKLPLASEETCANYCKTDIECCSFQYGLKRFGF